MQHQLLRYLKISFMIKTKTAEYIQDAVNAAILKDRKEQDELRQNQAVLEKNNNFFDKSDALAVDDSEYAELVEAGKDVQMSNLLKEELMESSVGAELHKHILKNPDALLKINNLSFQYPAAAKSQIRAIEASIKNQSQGQTKENSATDSPEPMKVAGGSSAEKSEIPPGMKFF